MHMLTLAAGLMSSACVNSGTLNEGKQRRPTGDIWEEEAPRCAAAQPRCEKCLRVFIFALCSFCCPPDSRLLENRHHGCLALHLFAWQASLPMFFIVSDELIMSNP